nr:MAG TPA: hypothetical protein [Caudoviricetes sp.]
MRLDYNRRPSLRGGGVGVHGHLKICKRSQRSLVLLSHTS